MDRLVVRGAREHNLKDVHLDLPRDALIVFTGLSGSGKSSLAFDTIFAEGQRRYVESLSAYARQFLGQMDKPDVDFIEGLSPAVSIDQKSTNRNPRSTVGTITEVYDYLRLLYARAGQPHCPNCGKPISRQTPQQIVDQVLGMEEGTRFQVLAPVVRARKGEYVDLFSSLQTQGFSRVRVDGVVHSLTEPPKLKKQEKHSIEVIIDRLTVKESAKRRLTDSVETALGLAGGLVVLEFVDLPDDDPQRERTFSEHLACVDDGLSFEALEPRSFSFNSPFGACTECTGIGTRKEVDPELVVPDPEKSLAQGAIAPWSTSMSNEYFTRLLTGLGQQIGFSMDEPWERLPAKVQKAILHGSPDQVHVRYKNRYGRERSYYAAFEGVLPFLERRHDDTDSDYMRDKYEGYMRDVPCPVCHGTRLKPEILAVKLNGRSIAEVTNLSIGEASQWLGVLELGEREKAIADRVLREIQARLSFLVDVGLDYLSLDRPAATLAGGEAQRIRLATQIGSGPGRRPLRARRALDRAAPAGQQPADRDADPAARHGQHADRRRARRGHHQGRRLGGRHRPGRRRARRRGRRQRHGRRPAGQRAVAHRPVPLRPQVDRDPGEAPRADAGPRAGRQGRPREQPARHRRDVPARRPGRRHRGVRVGQVHAGQRHPLHDDGQRAEPRAHGRRPAPHHHRPGPAGQGRARRPVADRPHPAVQPGHLHRRVGPGPQAVRPDHRGEDARLPARAGSPSTSRAGAARPAPATAR